MKKAGLGFVLLISGCILYLEIVWPEPHRLSLPELKLSPQAGSATCRETAFRFDELIKTSHFISPSFNAAMKSLGTFQTVHFSSRHYSTLSGPMKLNVAFGNPGSRLDSHPAVFAPVPTEMSFDISVPDGAELEFGCACVSADEKPVKFSVEVKNGSREKVIWQEAVLPFKPAKEIRGLRKAYCKYLKPEKLRLPDAWRYVRIDLKEFQGQNVTLKFKTSSSSGGIPAFWADPVMVRKCSPDGYNVVFIILDAVPESMVGAYNPESSKISPNIDRLSAGGMRVENCITAANWTRPSVMSFLTGKEAMCLGLPVTVYPLTQEMKEEFYKQRIDSIPAMLEKKGYTSCAFTNNFFIVDALPVGIDLGFERITDMDGRYDTVNIANEAIKWLMANHDRKLFMYIHLNNTHAPGKPGLRYLFRAFRKPPEKPGMNFLDYLYLRAEVAYADEYVGRLTEAIDRLGLKEKTLVIVTADHGHLMDEKHNRRFTDTNRFSAGYSLYEEELRIPLVLYLPGVIRPGVYSQTISSCRLRDLIHPLFASRNRPVQSPLFDESAITDTGQAIISEGKLVRAYLLNNRYRYIRWEKRVLSKPFFKNSRFLEEMYDLKNDPGEENNLVISGNKESGKILNGFRTDDSLYLRVPVMNCLIFQSGEKPCRFSGRISAGGITVKEFNLTVSGKASVNFLTGCSYAGAEILLEIKLNGKTLPKERFFTGEILLNLFSLPARLKTSEDFKTAEAEKIPESLPEPKPNCVFLRVPYDAWCESGQTGIHDLGVAKVLKDWGYIQ